MSLTLSQPLYPRIPGSVNHGLSSREIYCHSTCIEIHMLDVKHSLHMLIFVTTYYVSNLIHSLSTESHY
jgi:hypothetical protein